MEPLRIYLNSLSRDEQTQFASRCGTSIGYLRKALSTKPIFDAALCVSIERESIGAVSRRDLRPDDWHRIWPELQRAADGVAGGPPCEELLKQEALREAQGGVRQPIDRAKVMT